MTEAFTGTPGRSVGGADTLAGCRAILDGETDDWAESSLYMVGTLDEARQKEKGRPRTRRSAPSRRQPVMSELLHHGHAPGGVVDERDVTRCAPRIQRRLRNIARSRGLSDRLVISVVSWRTADGAERYCAVRRGVFPSLPAATSPSPPARRSWATDSRLEATVRAVRAEQSRRTQGARRTAPACTRTRFAKSCAFAPNPAPAGTIQRGAAS